MQVLPNKLVAMFDIDETLVTLTSVSEEFKDDEMVVAWYGYVKLSPRQEYIEALKAHAMEGHNVIVWSGGGAEWAEKVVKKLGLESYVDLIIPKPTVFYDDERPEDFMRYKVYVPSNNVTNPLEYVQTRLEELEEENE